MDKVIPLPLAHVRGVNAWTRGNKNRRGSKFVVMSNNHCYNLLLLSLLIIAFIDPSICCEQNLTPPSDECVCAGHLLQLNCTVVGRGFTVWSVDNQQCIELDHLQYDPDGITRSCGNAADAPTGSSVSVMGDCYTSQLTVMATPNLNGTNVTCEHDNGISEENIIIGVYPIILCELSVQTIVCDGIVGNHSNTLPTMLPPGMLASSKWKCHNVPCTM